MFHKSHLLLFLTLTWVLPACLWATGVRAGQSSEADNIFFDRKFTHNNRVGLTVTNYGFFGNNLADRQPSLEYPLGSGLDHLVRAGLWVGARTLPADTDTSIAATTHVSVGCPDGYYATSTRTSEFTPLGSRVDERSRLPNSRFYSHDAVSEEDFLADFTDDPGYDVTGTERHVPMHLVVHVETYSWSFDLANSFVVLHCTIKNTGPLLRNVYVALYSQLVSNNKKLYSGWPPSGTNGPRSWFYTTQLDYADSLKLVEEHYCFTKDVCNTERICPAWAGVKYLGTRTPNPLVKPHFQWWIWDPNSPARGSDVQKYALLSDTSAGLPTSAIQLTTDSPVEMTSLGPFPVLPTDSTISADFAFVGGFGREDLEAHARFAQLAFDLNYVLPEPPPSPKLHLVPRGNELDLYWDGSPDSVIDPTSLRQDQHDFEGYRVYLGHSPDTLLLAAQNDVMDDVPPNTGLQSWRLAQPRYFPGDSTAYVYRYTLHGLRDGFKYFTAVTSFDKGDARIVSLESGRTQNLAEAVPGLDSGQVGGRGVSVFPNPYRVEARWDAGAGTRDHYLWFVGLPPRARVRIYTLGGDLVKSFDFDSARDRDNEPRGVYDPNSTAGLAPPSLSGTMRGWDLISDHDQAVGSGIYLYSVTNLKTGASQVGKFAVIKSDRDSGP